MKILFPLSIFYPSQFGGPSNTIYWHAKALSNNKIKTTIITTDYGIKDENFIKDEFIFSEAGKTIYTRNKSINIKAFKSIISEIKKNDIIHLNSLFSYLSIFSIFYLKLFYPSKVIIWSVRGELNKNALKFSKQKKKLILPIFKILKKNINFHSTSEQETIDIKRYFPGNNIIQLPNFLEPCKRINVEKKKQLLFLGRIHEIKAIHKLIEALYLSKYFRGSDYKLIIAGKPEERHLEYLEKLKELVSKFNLNDKIEFIGHVEGYNKEKIYAESELLILPSETENFGNVVVEALNQSTVVLASKGTPWKILEDYNCGFHVHNNPDNLSNTIDKYILLNNLEKELMRTNATDLIDNVFDIKIQINKWIKVYSDLINN